MTGHLVLSTLHTNGAIETITRLLDMGVEPYLITSSVTLILAQRLMRKTCESCKTETTPKDVHLKILDRYELDISGHQFYYGEGCGYCNNTGYKGRSAIYEVFQMTEDIQEMVLKGDSSRDMTQKAKENGLIPLHELGFKKTIQGETSLDEWFRILT